MICEKYKQYLIQYEIREGYVHVKITSPYYQIFGPYTYRGVQSKTFNCNTLKDAETKAKEYIDKRVKNVKNK